MLFLCNTYNILEAQKYCSRYRQFGSVCLSYILRKSKSFVSGIQGVEVDGKYV